LSHGRPSLADGDIVTTVQDAGVNPGMQSLDPTVEHLGKAGEVLDRHDRNPSLGQSLGSAAGRENFDVEPY